MDTPPLPQTSPQGGPNPNTNPGGWGVSVTDLPLMPQLIGQATATTPDAQRAQFMQLAQNRQQTALAPSPSVPTAVGNLPTFNAPASAPAVDPNLTGIGNAWANHRTAEDQQAALGHLQRGPGWGSSIYNYLFNPVGSPEAQAHAQQSTTANFYNQPDAAAYLSQHPDLATAATANPVRFATALGPILEAHQKQLANQQTPGAIPVQTPDGVAHLPVDNMERHAALKSALGTSDHGTAILMHPEKYDAATWAHAALAHGVTNNQLKMMWEMQHYLNPQQQALQTAQSLAMQDAQRAGFTDHARAELARLSRVNASGMPLSTDYSPAKQ